MNTKADINLCKDYQEELDIIQQVMQDPIMAIPFLGNIIAIIKPDCYEKGIREFPPICMIGKPQTGKTYLARALNIMNNGEDEMIVSSTRKNVIEKKCEENKGYYLLLDDFANFSSPDTRRKSCNLLDCIIRPSYAGQTAQFIMSAEPEIIKSISSSLLTRIIFLKMDGWKNKDNKQILDKAKKHHCKLEELLQKFKYWFEAYSIDYDNYRNNFERSISQEVKNFDEIDDRAISNIFMVDLARKIFSTFLKSEFNTSLNEQLTKFYDELLHEMSKKPITDIELMKKFLLEILGDETFEFTSPKARLHCEDAVFNLSCRRMLEYNECPCYKGSESISYYNPGDLASFHTIFIKNPKRLYGFPKYRTFNGSLLIMPVELFSEMVNDALDSFCLTHNLKMEDWTIKHISELLKQLDVIMYNAKSKRTGQFTRYPYINKEYANKSVYIFKLRGELKQLFENRQEIDIDLSDNDDFWYYNSYYAHALEEIWKICRAGCGKTDDSLY